MALSKEERKRLEKMSLFEKGIDKEFIAGVDEAGRGPLAGPVVAAACILKKGFLLEGIDDSKKLSVNKRREVFKRLVNSRDVILSVGVVSAKVIDEINILRATFLAMEIAIGNLKKRPSFILVDGKSFPHFDIPTKGIVKGDSKSISIAAASIIAKVFRDILLKIYHKFWPGYGFLNNKGYGTKMHMEAIGKYGPCKVHRYSFYPVSGYERTF
jgi:ribonuclease HII